MGTCATLTVYDDTLCTRPLLHVYRTVDGYPDCAAHQIADCLRAIRLTNGYFGSKTDRRFYANGMGHLAAIVAGAWLVDDRLCYVTTSDRLDGLREWEYELFPESAPSRAHQYENPVEICLRIKTCGEHLWTGRLKELDLEYIDQLRDSLDG